MIPQHIESIMQSLIDNGYEAYIIGGAVRDMMMCRTPSDYDIFTNASGDEILSIFPDGNIIGSDERRAKILTVVVNGTEVSQYRANGNRTDVGLSLEQHLSTCDFTINSMAMDINHEIIDNHYGMAHLRSKDIYCVGDPEDRIKEDKLRALRAIRFAVKYDFSIEKQLSRVIFDTDITDLPIERIREEMLKTFMYPGALAMFEQSNLLEKIIPEFEPSVLLDGGHYHNETVDDHMYKAQDIACGLTDNSILVFACAFHDIGKPSTMKHKDDGGISFHSHETVGAEILNEIMNRMKFSNDDIKYVTKLVAEHMFGSWNNKTSNRGFVKHFTRLEDGKIPIEDYVILLYSDNQSNRKNLPIKFGDFIKDNISHKKYYELRYSKIPFRVKDIEISGHDLIKLGVSPGIEIGKFLNHIFNEILNGSLKNDHGTLMYYIKNLIKSNKNNNNNSILYNK